MAFNMNRDLKEAQKAAKVSKASPTISNSKISNSIRSNSFKAINILIKGFLNKVKNGDVQLDTPKALKDVVTTFEQLKETETGGSKDTPPVNIHAATFYSHEFNEDPVRGHALNANIRNKLKNASPEAIHDLLHNQAKSINNKNLKGM